MLKGVSRTFAITLPYLPESVGMPYGNAYLLCRITDTIEDETSLTAEQKQPFFERFAAVVAGQGDPQAFARDFGAVLSASTTAQEHDLVAQTARVVHITHNFGETPRGILQRCVKTMASGMAEFQLAASPQGLEDLPHFNRYCYHVAGVVGEMMTGLFCDYSQKIAAHRDTLMTLSLSFGQGLQMTNILQDIWEDRRRGICWLPRDLFRAAGFDLEALSPDHEDPDFERGLRVLIALGHHHLARALRYTLLIPRRETGLRLYCLWTLGMSVLTLRQIGATVHFKSRQEVKISRRSVWAVLTFSKLLVRSNTALKLVFWVLTRRLAKGAQAMPKWWSKNVDTGAIPQ